MRCDQHPYKDAVGTCVYCGRGVCEDCKVRIYDKLHCKECVEAGRTRGNEPPQPVYQPAPYFFYQAPPIIKFPPKPKGPTNAAPLRIGAMGALLSAIALFVMGGSFYIAPMLLLVSLVLFSVGLMILAIACYGIYWNFGCFWGAFGTISLPIMGALLLLFGFILSGSLQALSSFFLFWVIPLLVTSMVFVHLSLGHTRLHLPTNSKLYGLMNLNRVLNYLGGAGVAAFLMLSIFLFFIAGGILMLDFWILMNLPVPDPTTQQPPQPSYAPAYYPPRY